MRRATQARGESPTDFIVRSACTEAELALTDQHHFSLSAEQWDAFIAALDRPAEPKPRLDRLFSDPGILER